MFHSSCSRLFVHCECFSFYISYKKGPSHSFLNCIFNFALACVFILRIVYSFLQGVVYLSFRLLTLASFCISSSSFYTLSLFLLALYSPYPCTSSSSLHHPLQSSLSVVHADLYFTVSHLASFQLSRSPLQCFPSSKFTY